MTAELSPKRLDPPTQVFDGFISYSHAADGLLAPRLQSALQRFAKPWWQRRAVRIFRDESSLSANPHLWSSITDALDASGWFVLLLSPDAARSDWVNQEISYWVEHRDPSRILPVVTAGEFGWSDGAVSGNAVPEALRGVFAEEPRWVDVRWVKDEDHLDLQDPRFAYAVADIASTVRGIPKDDLASEEVHQHRRTVRTAWAVGGLVTVLAVFAIVFGIQSGSNASEAENQAALAAEQAERADREAAVARRAEATARARELASASINATGEDAQLALLLAAEALSAFPEDAEPGPDLERAVRAAMASDRLLASRPYELGVGGLDVSPDGRQVAVAATRGGVVEMLDSDTLEPVWTYSEDTRDFFGIVSFSSSGRYVVVSVQDQQISYFHDLLEDPPEGEPDARVIVLDAADGSVVKELVVEGACGAYVAKGAMNDTVGILGFGFVGCGPEENDGVFRFVDTTDWSVLHEATAADFPLVAIAPDGSRAALFSGYNGDPLSAVIDTSTWEVEYDMPYRMGWFSPDGATIAGLRYQYDTGGNWAELADAYSGVLLDRFAVPLAPWISSFDVAGGSQIAIGSYSDLVVVFDLVSGEQLLELPVGLVTDLVLRENLLFLASPDALNVWLVEPPGGDIASTQLGNWVNSNSVVAAGDTIVGLAGDQRVNQWWLLSVDPATGLLRELIASEAAFDRGFAPISGGRIVMFRSGVDGVPVSSPGPEVAELGPLEVLELETRETSVLLGCWMLEEGAFAGETCPDGSPHPAGILVASPDGSEFAIVRERTSDDDPWRVTIWDSATLAPIEELLVDNYRAPVRRGGTDLPLLMPNHMVMIVSGAAIVQHRRSGESMQIEAPEFTPRLADADRDGNRVWFASEVGAVWVVDLEAHELRPVTPGEGAEVRGIAPSPTGDRIAVMSTDDLLRVYSDGGELLHLIPIHNPSDAYWVDNETLAVASSGGPWGLVTLDFERLEQALRDQLRRALTGEECSFYRIDPCPTLDEVRSR